MIIKNNISSYINKTGLFILKFIIAVIFYCLLSAMITQIDIVVTNRSEKNIISQLNSIIINNQIAGFVDETTYNLDQKKNVSNSTGIKRHIFTIEPDSNGTYHYYAIKRKNKNTVILYELVKNDYSLINYYLNKPINSKDNVIDSIFKNNFNHSFNICDDNKLLLEKLLSLKSGFHRIAYSEINSYDRIIEHQTTKMYPKGYDQMELSYTTDFVPIYDIYISRKKSVFYILFFIHFITLTTCAILADRIVTHVKNQFPVKDEKRQTKNNQNKLLIRKTKRRKR